MYIKRIIQKNLNIVIKFKKKLNWSEFLIVSVYFAFSFHF